MSRSNLEEWEHLDNRNWCLLKELRHLIPSWHKENKAFTVLLIRIQLCIVCGYKLQWNWCRILFSKGYKAHIVVKVNPAWKDGMLETKIKYTLNGTNLFNGLNVKQWWSFLGILLAFFFYLKMNVFPINLRQHFFLTVYLGEGELNCNINTVNHDGSQLMDQSNRA